MKLMLRWIPTEVWVDIFCYPWISRKKLGKLVHRFKNRYFVEILQYCLHGRGRRTLRVFDLDKIFLQILPQTPMPANIKFLEHILISHLCSQTLDFLRNISTLFKDVNLLFHNIESSDLAKLRVVLDHLTPLFHGINSLAFDRRAIPLVEQHFGPKLAQVKLLTLDLSLGADEDATFGPADEQSVNFCLNWLTSGEQDPIEPKFLEVYYCSEVQQFAMAVRQQFQSAKRPSTFAIKFGCTGDFDFHLDLNLENTIGEQLHGQFDKYRDFWIYRHPADSDLLIYRHPADSNRTQLEEWVEETAEERDSFNGIEFWSKLTVGQIKAGPGDNEVNDTGNDKAEADQPSTSKKQ